MQTHPQRYHSDYHSQQYAFCGALVFLLGRLFGGIWTAEASRRATAWACNQSCP